MEARYPKPHRPTLRNPLPALRRVSSFNLQIQNPNLSVHCATDSSDHLTTKLLIKLQSGALFEAMIMRYDSSLGKHNGKSRHGGARSTLCVSSQVGCKMGCMFCVTGSMGFKSNLTYGEIVEQLVHASRISPIRNNVVFMGMGEPLNNYNLLVEAIRVLTGLPFQLSPRRITVSMKQTTLKQVKMLIIEHHSKTSPSH